MANYDVGEGPDIDENITDQGNNEVEIIGKWQCKDSPKMIWLNEIVFRFSQIHFTKSLYLKKDFKNFSAIISFSKSHFNEIKNYNVYSI